MLSYLIEREKEEMFRTSTRTLDFPDGETRKIEAYRLVWSWFDRVIAYRFGPDEEELLNLTLEYASKGKVSLGEALGWALDGFVRVMETEGGGDITDDNVCLVASRRVADSEIQRSNGK